MTTFADIKAEIADDIDDTTGEYAVQIGRAVNAAIRYAERFAFYFNETRDRTFATVAGRQWYDSADLADIPSLVRIQAAFLVDGGGQVTDLIRLPVEEIEILSDNTAATGQPYGFAYFGKRVRLYPIPDAVYTIRLQLGPYRLGTLAADSDSNAWLEEAYDMIKARAKYLIHKDTTKDPGLAAEALSDYQDQFAVLKAETSARNGAGRIVPTQF
jgi:hypothetical protein